MVVRRPFGGGEEPSEKLRIVYTQYNNREVPMIDQEFLKKLEEMDPEEIM